ncbi:MAG TPA: hypothetical protein VG205_09670, partial [Acidimicrobiales bacterium]|nr:hypothetical protein [Acidimicrobiales bacterium]
MSLQFVCHGAPSCHPLVYATCYPPPGSPKPSLPISGQVIGWSIGFVLIPVPGGIATAVTRLRRSDCTGPGIQRRRHGRGFTYRWTDGPKVSDPDVLARIRDLVIPPAWKDVWICPWPHGHIQALGTDDAGRRQYLYHQQWRLHRDREKFDRAVEFGAALPKLRGVVESDLSSEGFGRDRVTAGLVRLLDIGLFRIGSEQYAEENNTFGLST